MPSRLPLFGASSPWSSTDWSDQSDSVRGGNSSSTLSPTHNATHALFSGTLDDSILGAGFASQRTTGDRAWNLSGYDGLEMVVQKAEGAGDKTLTMTLKDTIPADNDETKTTISYEHSFTVPSEETAVYIPWKAFTATYRGREMEDAPALELADVKRMAFMVRSFFGRDEQRGRFEVLLERVAAVTEEGKREREKERWSVGCEKADEDEGGGEGGTIPREGETARSSSSNHNPQFR